LLLKKNKERNQPKRRGFDNSIAAKTGAKAKKEKVFFFF
jgi:hypothetical protein